MSKDKNDLSEIISIRTASDYSGLSMVYLRLLVRTGKIEGIKIGHNWATTKKAVDEFLKLERRPGPKK